MLYVVLMLSPAQRFPADLSHLAVDRPAEIEEDFTMEDAMQMILTEVDHVAEHETGEPEPAAEQGGEAQPTATAAEQVGGTAREGVSVWLGGSRFSAVSVSVQLNSTHLFRHRTQYK